MFRRSVFSFFILASLVYSASAFSLKVDIGDLGQPVKAGWREFSGDANNEADPKTEVYDVDGRSISVSIRTGILNYSVYRSYGGGDIGGDMVYPFYIFSGPVNGSVILTVSNLAAGRYSLTSYHNDTQGSHLQQDPIDVTVSGAVSESAGAAGVIQTKSMSDTGLGQSTVTFTADGTGDVVITYSPTTDNGIVSKAVLNGFELVMADTMVEFELEESSGLESVSPAILNVRLDNLDDSNTIEVDYEVTGGTADGGGEDYTLSNGTLIFDPCVTTQMIEIAIIDSNDIEYDETIEVTLSNPQNAGLGPIFRHTYTIIDPGPSVNFDANSSDGRENVSPAYVAVSLSAPSVETVTVDYNVAGGTAIYGEDFELEAGTLVFDACEVTKYIPIQIIADEYKEDPDETIEMNLSNPSNAKLGLHSEHVFTIIPPVFEICPDGDMDCDCDVDFNDVRIFVGQWLVPSGECSGDGCADIDGLDGVNMRDYGMLTAGWLESRWPVVINEFMASNDDTIQDPEAGEYCDWIELYNGGPFEVALGGMYLTDDLNTPMQWQIPSDVNIAPGEHLLFWADGVDARGPMHTNFKLSASGEEIGLFASDGTTLLDSMKFREQIPDISYGRYPDASSDIRFFAKPTPGTVNVGAYLGQVENIQCSNESGFLDRTTLVSLWCDTSGSEIHYTIDGSEPSWIIDGVTRLYTREVAIRKSGTLRAAAYKAGYRRSEFASYTYIFLDDIVNGSSMDPCTVVAVGEEVIKDYLQSLPILSIAMKPLDLEDLQLQDSDSGNKEELPAGVELMYPDANDGEGFKVTCAIEGHSGVMSKRSYKLIFKSAFGPSQLRYPFFETAPHNSESAVEEFDRIVLRSSKNMPITYAGDQWTRDTQIAMSGVGSHGTYFHLYLNGAYWGVYNAVERPDASFASSYTGGEKEDYFATNHGIEREQDHISGDSSRYDAMMSMVWPWARNLGDAGNYETFKGLCDVTNFADYTILFWFAGFGDGINNNWYGGMRNDPLIGEVPPEGWAMYMWDAEWVFKWAAGPPGSAYPWVPYYYFYEDVDCEPQLCTITNIWLALYENPDFRMLFADRIYKHCFNNGALVEANAQLRWNTLVDHLSEASICELARWGEYYPQIVDMTGFVDIFMSELYYSYYYQQHGVVYPLYPDIDPPIFNQYGGHVPTDFELTMSNPNGSGTIYYTLDGSDPREAVTGNPVGTVYGGSVTLNESKHVKARVFDDPNWSALNEATFDVGPVENMRVTEIMYHPEDINDPNEEFIELQNVGAESVNMNLVKFTNGIDFTFGSVSVPSGGYVVVVQDAARFALRYPGFSGVIAGEYNGRFNNAGERIRLEDSVGDTILDFRYEDGWREITDGQDYSLTIINPSNSDVNSWGEKESWRASVYVGGSPGEDDSGILPNPDAIVINEFMSHSHGSASDWIELYNTTGSAIDIGGWFLSDSDSNLTKYEFEAGTSIGSGEYLVVYEDVNFGDTNDPGCHVPFALSENGEKVCLSSWVDGNGKLTGYRSVEDFGAAESDVSFGRYHKTSTDNYNFVAMDYNTPGTANAYPKVGPIVINEIMYHPDWIFRSPYGNEQFEFVELLNISSEAVTLYDYDEEAAWKFTDGIEFTFPEEPPVTIPAGGSLLVVKDPEAFAWRYSDVPSWKILGPYDGKLSNGGEKVELSMPGDENEFAELCYIRVDRVGYSDGSHPEDCPGDVDQWPVGPDGDGNSLTRIDANLYGNDPNNWISGGVNPESTVSVLLINEFMASNTSTIQDDHGEYDDWIEMCNLSSRTIDLGGMYLTDDFGSPTEWQIPDGVSIEGGEYLLFWADGTPGQGDLHADFGLGAGGGEDVGLFDTDGAALIDGLTNFPSQSADNSYGREPDGTSNWVYISSPTPGTGN